MNVLNNDLLLEGHSQDMITIISFPKNYIYNTMKVSSYKLGKDGIMPPDYVLGVNVYDKTRFNNVVFLIDPKGFMAYENINGFVKNQINQEGKNVVLLINMECESNNMLIREPYFKLINDEKWEYK